MTYLQLGVMRNSTYAGGLGGKRNLPNAILILLQGVRGPVPFVYGFSVIGVSHMRRWPDSRRTEIACKDGLYGIRCPFSVNERSVVSDVETKFEEPFGKRVITSLVLLYGVLPLCE